MRSTRLAVGVLSAWSFAAAGATLCPSPQPPLVWDREVHQPPALAEPAARVPFRDPVFGACTARLTDRTRDIASGDDSAGLKNEYSRVQSWNADESRILIRGISSTWYLYDAATLQPLGQLPLAGSVDPRWDASDPNVLYFNDGTQLMRLDVRQSAPTLVRDFAGDFPGQELAFVWTRYEGSPSIDGRLWGFMTQTADDRHTAFLVYDLPADRILAQRDMRGVAAADALDAVSISPLGTYFAAYFDTCETGTLGTDASPCGLMVYDQNLRNGRGLLRWIGHSDFALDEAGREVVVYQDNDTDFISVLDLATGAVTPLLPIDFSQEAIGLHFSGRGFRRPGWAVVSTHDSTPDSLTWMDDEVFLLELKAEGRTLRVSHTHSVVDPAMEQDYWAEPHATANHDLTKVLFTTNWGRVGTGAVETMLVELPGGWAGAETSTTLFVPVVLRTSGMAESFYTSELTLGNRGDGIVSVSLAYTGTDGTSGSANETLGPRRQRVVPDAIEWLRTKGVPIPADGAAVGTLRATFSGLADTRDAVVLVRTTTPVPPAAPTGAAGLSYSGVRLAELPSGPVLLGGLRNDGLDRSNVAVQNAGAPADGSITLSVIFVLPGDALYAQPVTLAPGGFEQVAVPSGFHGFVRVERTAGSAPFYAYGVVNDAANSDGAFVPPIPVAGTGTGAVTIPVLVEASAFTSEVIVTNTYAMTRRVRLALHAEALGATPATMTLDVPGSARVSIPDFVAALRATGVPVPSPVVGPLVVTDEGGDASWLLVGARTGNPGGGGRYSVFTTGVPVGSASSSSVWLDGLQQTATTRTNLAVVNTGEADTSTDTFLVEVFDGATGTKAGETTLTAGARRQVQIDRVLTLLAPGTAQGRARVTRTSGTNPFVAYAVLNDGATPGERSGDGAWVSSD